MCIFYFLSLYAKIKLYSKLVTIKKICFIVIPDFQGKADKFGVTLFFSKGKVSSTLYYATYSYNTAIGGMCA